MLLRLVILTMLLLQTGTARADPRIAQIFLDDPLRSVSIIGDQVYASNRFGIFRAPRDGGAWRALPLPEDLPVGGRFAQQTDDSDQIYYFGSGIHVSEDQGASWQLVNSEHRFSYVYRHMNGDLYANTYVREGDRDRQRLFRSVNGGESWTDITGDLPRGLQLWAFFQDPDHPNLVCLNASSNRGYVLQAEDDSYDWNLIRESFDWEVQQRDNKDYHLETFFFGRIFYGAVHYDHRATLANYFDADFGENTAVPGIQIDLEPIDRNLAAGESLKIRLQVRMLPSTVSTIFIDDARTNATWWLQVFDPNGVRHSESARIDEADAEAFRAHAFIRHDLTRATPYIRELDLSEFHDFSVPGTYRIQLCYDSSRCADRDEGEWRGGFRSEPFEVHVQGVEGD